MKNLTNTQEEQELINEIKSQSERQTDWRRNYYQNPRCRISRDRYNQIMTNARMAEAEARKQLKKYRKENK